jgi:hypothetical protein
VVGSLNSETIAQEARRIHRDLTYQAATPMGLARLVGEAQESDLAPEVLTSFLGELEILESTDLSRFFERLRQGTPIREEIRP